jgi:hypothetical protein
MIIIGAAAYEIFEFELYRPQISETGSVTVTSNLSPGQKVKAQTRLAIAGRRSLWQVEVSPGGLEGLRIGLCCRPPSLGFPGIGRPRLHHPL